MEGTKGAAFDASPWIVERQSNGRIVVSFKGKELTFLDLNAAKKFLRKETRRESRLASGKTIVRLPGQAQLDETTLLPIRNPKPQGRVVVKGKTFKRFSLADGPSLSDTQKAKLADSSVAVTIAKQDARKARIESLKDSD